MYVCTDKCTDALWSAQVRVYTCVTFYANPYTCSSYPHTLSFSMHPQTIVSTTKPPPQHITFAKPSPFSLPRPRPSSCRFPRAPPSQSPHPPPPPLPSLVDESTPDSAAIEAAIKTSMQAAGTWIEPLQGTAVTSMSVRVGGEISGGRTW